MIKHRACWGLHLAGPLPICACTTEPQREELTMLTLKTLTIAMMLTITGLTVAEAARFCHCWVSGGIQYCRCY